RIGQRFALSRGTYGFHPNEIGTVLAFLLPVGLALLLGSGGQAWRSGRGQLVAPAGVALVCVAMAGVLLLTQSRSAYLGLLAGLMAILVWQVASRPRSSRGRRFGVALLGVAGVGAGWGGWRLITTWSRAREAGLESFPSRLELWSRSLSMLGDFPYTGIGLGQFSPVLHALYVPLAFPPDDYVPHAHNFFLQLAFDLGIPGAIAGLGLFAAFFRMLRAAYRGTGDRGTGDRELRAVAVGLAAGVLSFMVAGLSDAIPLGARAGLMLWTAFGLGAAIARAAEAERSA